ncbi:hypothetical protein C0993_003500 [Termitomyces sp. T159_Od127]|nr:hypothetical protein C0993_003500 [Termitomyces sp. T159_Od127]
MVKASKASRTGSSSKLGKHRPSHSKANAAGYAKRHSKKAKALSGLNTDVYEYAPEAIRRSKMALDLNRDEAAEYGVGLDGDNEAREELRARLIGENGDDEMIESGDDEEIDSDAAFEESDEERFAGFFTDKKSRVRKPSVRFAEVDLNEDEDEDAEEMKTPIQDEDDEEEEEEEGDSDEFIDVLDVLDGRGEVDWGSDNEAIIRPFAKESRPSDQVGEENEKEGDQQRAREEESESEEMEEDELKEDASEEETSAFAPSDTEDVEPDALDSLQNFISTLDTTVKKRKVSDDDASAGAERTRKQRKVILKERTEAGVENEFRVQNSGVKLNLEDLLAPLASQSSTLQSLKQSTKALASTSSKVKTLSAPLPQRAQERIDREAAYDQTKEELNKWSDTMKRLREAEHLSFPLQVPNAARVSNLTLAAKFKPSTPLESSVDALLKSAKLREEDIRQTEETMLKMNKLSVEEVEQRRTELRKMRELMFRAEMKARRINKIKSKTYRKIKRKQREKLGGNLEDEEGSEREEDRLKREIERAKERATLRHKHTGKWAKKMRSRDGEEGRQEIEEMLARGEKLRRKIKGVESDDDSDDDGEDEEGHGDEGDVERIKQGAFDELQRLEKGDNGLQTEEGGSKKGKSIFEMKFMKDAMARQQQVADQMADDFIKEMGGQSGDVDGGDDDETPEVDPASSVVAQRVGGRISYHPGTTSNKRPLLSSRSLGSLASDTSSVTLKSTDLLSPPRSPLELQRPNVPLPTTSNANPWLVPLDSGSTSVKAPKKNNEVVVSKDSNSMVKSKNKLKKLARKRGEEKEKAVDDALVEISVDNVLTLDPSSVQSIAVPVSKRSLATSSKGKLSRSSSAVAQEDANDDDDANSEIEAQEKALELKGKSKAKLPQAFEQRELVALAFAGDNVVHVRPVVLIMEQRPNTSYEQEFQEAKKREIAADAPQEIDTTIPGWGSWGGTGIRPAPPKPQRIKKVAGIDPTTRADYGKAHVIISEKRDKKAAKYLVKDLPYPYTSKAQFEKTMERPLGTEWNTRVAFQKATMPHVVKKPGMIINPIEKFPSS